MSKFSLFKPVKPYHVNQAFGEGYDYYHANFGTNGHMGVDFMASHGQPIYAPIDGQAFFVKDPHGGEGIYIQTNEPFEYENWLPTHFL